MPHDPPRHEPRPFGDVEGPATPFTLIGLSLSIFMSLRNSACYDRWSEGRRSGAILTHMRSPCRETDAVADGPARTAIRMRERPAAVARCRRRAGPPHRRRARRPRPPPRRPRAARQGVGMALHGAGTATGGAGCHPGRRRAHPRRAAAVRLHAAPAPHGPPVLHSSAVRAGAPARLGDAARHGHPGPHLFGLDQLGNELEELFGRDAKNLPLDAMVRTFERATRAALGEVDLPPPLLPTVRLLQRASALGRSSRCQAVAATTDEPALHAPLPPIIR